MATVTDKIILIKQYNNSYSENINTQKATNALYSLIKLVSKSFNISS